MIDYEQINIINAFCQKNGITLRYHDDPFYRTRHYQMSDDRNKNITANRYVDLNKVTEDELVKTLLSMLKEIRGE